MKLYRLEKWKEGRMISAFEEESPMDFKKWKYFHAMQKLGKWRGELMRTYIDGQEDFINTDKN